nr:hypothetical protein [Tanacetum cinerariifolium]
VKCFTSASRSKPSSNTKNNKILQPSSSNKINKVEDQPRSVKTRKNKKNRVNRVKCNDHAMQSMSNADSVSAFISNAHVRDSVNDVKSGCLCAIYGKCMTAKTHHTFDHLQAGYNYHQRERVVFGNNYTRVNYNNSTRKTHPSAHRNMAPRAVLMKIILRPPNTARPVNTAHPRTTVYSARPMLHFSTSTKSTVKRPYQQRTTLTNISFSQKVNNAKGKFYTARPRAVNTARPNSAAVNAVRGN